MTNPARLTVVEAIGAIRARKLSPADLLEACLARVAEREPLVHAFAHIDPERLRDAGRATRPGPLHGIPIGVKDVIDTADMPTAYGSPIWEGHRPRADAASVAAMRAAGAVVMGKTVTAEFATRHPGPTANPLALSHTPGGSSSGSAAAVADFMVPAALGTQTAGSIIRPAAFCGIVGYKPSFGTLHRGGMRVISESLDTIGVLARSVADCAIIVAAMSGDDFGDPELRPERTPRFGLTLGPYPEKAAEETLALIQRVVDFVRRAGAEVVVLDLPPPLSQLAALHPVIANIEARRALGWELAEAPTRLSPVLLERLEWARAQPIARFHEARRVQRIAIDVFRDCTDGLDAVLTPAAPGEAPKGLGSTGEASFNLLWTALRGPNVTIPAGAGPRGLPLGIQLVGRPGDDKAVLGWARWLQEALSS
jgi:Asp-tRNA(Asn)/Glu-tRNA(Gln) amidotransferase A subunit family amidase